MQTPSRSIRQIAVMAAIVTTMLCVPVGALLALFSFAVLGTSVRSFVTFGDRLDAVGGLLVWWLVVFVPAFGYATYSMRER
ncbi:MAG TPA: hypothetical protein VEQ87_02495 [Burkholderiales bacterium]|nr:hypothetical protein [Burkholderiales bacterium]